MGQWISSAVVFLLTCSALNATDKGPSTQIAPAYRIDLRSVIKANAVPQLGTRETPWVPVVTLHFLDNERLAATVVARAEVATGLAARDKPDAASPFRLRCVLIQASTGKILAKPEWPSNSRAAGIVAANDSGFVTESGSELTLFSPDFAPIKQLAVPPCAATHGHAGEDSWYPNASWSGEHVLLVSGPFWSKGCWLWVDAANLRVLASWQDDRTGPVAIADDQLVLKPFGRHFGDPPSPLKVAVPGRDWTSVPSTLDALAPQFVGPGILYFHRYIPGTVPPRTKAFLIRTDGSEISRLEATRDGWGPGQAAVSRAGNRFVILQAQVRGSHPALDIGGHSVLKGLLVYEVPFRAPSYTVKVQDSKVRNPSAALSPDGRHLAVLGSPEPLLEVFELPPAK
jgi:hypothetical protein